MMYMRIVQAIGIGILLSWSVCMLLTTGADPDLWGHVRYGCDNLTHGLAKVPSYTYTAREYEWVNHELLSELVLGFAFGTLGTLGLQGIRLVLAAAMISLLFLRSWQLRARYMTAVVVTVVTVSNVMFNWMLRPQIFSFVFFAAVLLILSYAFPDDLAERPLRSLGKQNLRSSLQPTGKFLPYRLLWLPLLMVVWTNTHGGFAAGLAVLTLYLFGRCVEFVLSTNEGKWRSVAFVASVWVCTLTVTVINPYGWSYHRWVWEAISLPRPEIMEWRGMDWSRPRSWNVGMLVTASCFLWYLTRRRVDRIQIVVFMVVALQASFHHRHVPFLVLLFSFWMMPYVDEFLSLSDDLAFPKWFMLTWARVVLIAVLSGIGYYFGSQAWHRVGEIRVSCQEYPVVAVQFMRSHGLDRKGKIVTMFHWAQYVIGACGARTAQDEGLQVAFDGRFETVYPQHLREMFLDFELGNYVERHRTSPDTTIDGTKILSYREPDLVLIHRLQSHAVESLEKVAQDWVLLYQDGLAQLWGRKAVFDRPDSSAYFPAELREVSDTIYLDYVAYPAFPTP